MARLNIKSVTVGEEGKGGRRRKRVWGRRKGRKEKKEGVGKEGKGGEIRRSKKNGGRRMKWK